MKPRPAVFIIIFFASYSFLPAGYSAAPGGTAITLAETAVADADRETGLRNAIERFNLAYQNADAEALDAMLTVDYVHTNSGGAPLDRDQWLGWIKTRRALAEKGQLTYDTYKTEELRMKFYNDIAIVTGRNIASGINQGKPFNVDIRFTQVWVEEGDTWKRAAFHDAPTKP